MTAGGCGKMSSFDQDSNPQSKVQKNLYNEKKMPHENSSMQNESLATVLSTDSYIPIVVIRKFELHICIYSWVV